MPAIRDFGQTERVAITVLVDNRADLMMRSTRRIKYFTAAPLLAEHGFAALIHLKDAGVRILWDAGITEETLLANMARMKIDPSRIDRIALSHGHGDHTGAMFGVLKSLDLSPKPKEWKPGAPMQQMVDYAVGRRVPLIAHPAAFRERWVEKEDGTRYGPFQPPPRVQWEAVGAELVLSEGPRQLGPGCWSTGYVPRRSFENAGRRRGMRFRRGEAFLPDDLEEDQAIAIHVAGKGLVVLSGCAHSGIVNTVEYAREISGVERVWAIVGGFHLAQAANEEIRRTVEAIRAYRPALVCPTHCSGFGAQVQFAVNMPKEFVAGAVGMTLRF